MGDKKFLLFLTLLLSLHWCVQSNADILVVAPHPDDDIISTAGIITAAVKRGERVTTVFMTNGDYAGGETTGTIRQNEAVNAQLKIGTTENDFFRVSKRLPIRFV